MSVGAVYVVVVAGASLALFACLGIYAVRQGPGASLDWEVPAGEKKRFLIACMIAYHPLIHSDMIQKEDLLQSLVAEKGCTVCFLSSSDSEDLSCWVCCSTILLGGCPCSSQQLEERA